MAGVPGTLKRERERYRLPPPGTINEKPSATTLSQMFRMMLTSKSRGGC